jgi:hypothetical protein
MAKDSNKLRDQFYIARAEALNAYALLEKSLALLFSKVLETDPRYATLIISKIVNTRARNEIVQRVIDMHTVGTFKAFTNSLFARITEADSERNKLVHWHVDIHSDPLSLRPTNFLSATEDRMSEAKIEGLWKKAMYLASVVNEFDTHLQDWARDPTLHEKYLRPLCYPPEPDAPQFQFYIDIERPPRSSQA